MQTEEAVKAEPSPATIDAEALADYLRERDVACPLCRYNLRGLETQRCPECGRELCLSVGLAEPRLAAWIVAAAASLLPAGVGVLLVFALIASGWDSVSDVPPMLFASMMLFFAFIPISAALLLWRRRFMRLEQRSQWIAAALLLVGAAVSFTTYMMGFD
jgi:hypothetical protein